MPGMEFDRAIDWVMFGGSLASVISTSFVILSGALFTKNRKKVYIEVVAYMSLACFFSALSTTVGTPPTGSPACYFEGVVSSAGTLSSVFWAVVISFMLFSIVVYEKMYVIGLYTHLFCWLFPVLLSVLPFSNATYGGDDDISGWCFIYPTSKTPAKMVLMWFWLSFYAPLWSGMVIIIVLFGLTTYSYRTNGSIREQTKGALQKAFSRLQGFPWIIFLSWSTPTILDTMIRESNANLTTHRTFRVIYIVSTGLAVSQGLFASIFFFYTNPEVASDWQALICGMSFDKFSTRNADESSLRSKRSFVASSSSKKILATISKASVNIDFNEEESSPSESNLKINTVGTNDEIEGIHYFEYE